MNLFCDFGHFVMFVDLFLKADRWILMKIIQNVKHNTRTLLVEKNQGVMGFIFS